MDFTVALSRNRLHHFGMTPAVQQKSSSLGSQNRLTERSWIDAAIQQIIKANISDIRVEGLARELGVTKGSFYWHFRDREHLLHRILEQWAERATTRITERSKSENAGGAERLAMLLSLPSTTPVNSRGADIELAVRSWARRDKTAADFVAKIDKLRFENFLELFLELGSSTEKARHQSAIAQAFMLGDAFLKSGLTQDERHASARVCAEIILSF